MAHQGSFFCVRLGNDFTEHVTIGWTDVHIIIPYGVCDFKSKLFIEGNCIVIVCLHMQVDLPNILLV